LGRTTFPLTASIAPPAPAQQRNGKKHQPFRPVNRITARGAFRAAAGRGEVRQNAAGELIAGVCGLLSPANSILIRAGLTRPAEPAKKPEAQTRFTPQQEASASATPIINNEMPRWHPKVPSSAILKMCLV